MKMHCPQCGVKGSVDDSYVGRKIRCPKCREEFSCRAEEEVLPGGLEQKPIAPHSWESPAPAPVDETTAAESPVPVLADEKHADRLDDSSPAVPQAFDEPEPSVDVEDREEEPAEEPEAVEEHAAELVPEAERAPDLIEEKESAGEELEVLIAEEAGPAPVEEVPAEPEQGSAADVGEPVVERQDEQEAPRFEEEHPSPLPEQAAMVPPPPAAPVLAADEQQTSGAEPQPAPGGFVQGVDPRTDFTIGEAFKEAWQYTKGAKGAIWAAVGMMYLVMLVLGFGLGFMQGVFGLDPASAAGIWAEIGIQAIISAISTIFTAGLMYIGVRRAAEKSYSWKMIFAGFQMAMKLLIAGILMTLLVISGLVLLVLPGIYLAVGYTMTLPLILDRQLEPWQAMEASRKAIHQVWWKMFGLFFVMGLLYLVSAIPLGIGLIWTVPLFVILGGVLYRYLFGVQAKTH